MLFHSVLLLAASSLGPLGIDARTISHAPRALKERSFTTSVSRPTSVFKRSSTIATTDNVVSLSKRSVKYNKRSAAYLLGKITDAAVTSTYANGSSSVLTSLFLGEEYATPITIGTQTLEVIVDTGSSDTWVVETGFECIDFDTGKETTESECEFGPYYTTDSTFVKTANENFNIEYGDGEYLTGIIGTETVTLAGVEVTDQTIALVTAAAWEGDGTTSGLTGLAYPALTSAYEGTVPADDTTQVEYSPIIETMITKDLIASPLFSLAILRDVSGDAGYLALGGVPPISFTQDFTSTPILVTTISGYPDTYDFYTINIDEVVLNGASVSGSGGSSIQYIVDSGTTLNYFPTSVANAINKAFSPAATYSDEDGAYIVSCTATAPTLAITIGGTAFTINPLDMILDAGDGICITGIDDGGDSDTEDIFVLGDTFQKNVVSIFDVGAVEMLFAPNEDYTSNDTYKKRKMAKRERNVKK